MMQMIVCFQPAITNGCCITNTAASPIPLHHQYRCITNTAASPIPLHHQYRCSINATILCTSVTSHCIIYRGVTIGPHVTNVIPSPITGVSLLTAVSPTTRVSLMAAVTLTTRVLLMVTVLCNAAASPPTEVLLIVSVSLTTPLSSNATALVTTAASPHHPLPECQYRSLHHRYYRITDHLEQCKGSLELPNSRARRVNKTEDLFLCDGYLIPCKPYPKGLPLSMPLPVLILRRAALAPPWYH